MRPLATSLALTGLALAVSFAAACSSTPESSAPTDTTTSPTSTTEAVQGPLSGTYSADTTDGTAPFITITFLDQSHYQYVAKSCVAVDLSEPGDGDDDDDDAGAASYPDLGADPGDQVADNGATPDYDADPTDDGCIHSGTYSFTASSLTLTDDGATAGVTVAIGQIAADGTEVTDPGATALTGESQTLEGATKPDSLVVGNNTSLFGSTSVSQFSAAGTSLRRTGLSTGSGVGSVCTVSTTGISGTCMTTSSCAAAGNTSTPDYCPGPANVQCCTTGSGSSGSGGSGGNTMSGLVANAAVVTAETWVSVKMPYCQAANGGRELDSACYNVTGRTCTRSGAANQAKWNKYRSDCSGLVSYSWGLAAPGLTTSGFLPGTAKYIPMEDLQPGDALIRPGTHMVLFKAWKNKAAGTATVVSEPGCSAKGGPFAQEQSWSMGKAPGAGTSAHWAGATYYSIRKKTAVITQ